jgi:hypothetical protein
MTAEFAYARELVLAAQMRLNRALRDLRATIPADDQPSLDEQIKAQGEVQDEVAMWLAHYGRPAVDPALVLEDLTDDDQAAGAA